MTDPSEDPVLSTLSVAPARRWIGVGTLALLGLLLLYVLVAHPPSGIGSVLVLLVFGFVALAGAEALRQATAYNLELTATELRESGGRRLALVAEIESVERGAFALKPSNGFMIRLKAPAARHWSPGLWWRLGRRIGVGGVTSAGEGKAMSEALGFLLAGQNPLDFR